MDDFKLVHKNCFHCNKPLKKMGLQRTNGKTFFVKKKKKVINNKSFFDLLFYFLLLFFLSFKYCSRSRLCLFNICI